MNFNFELNLNQTVKDNMIRIMQEQYENIKTLCLSYEKNTDKNIHEIRKSFKRLRALLRLIKYEIGYKSYFIENSFCRDESKLISDLRDLQVFHENLSNLAKENMNEDEEIIELLQHKIIEKKEKRFHEIVDGEIFKKIYEDVNSALARLSLLKFKNDDFVVVREGLTEIYKKGQKELGIVKKDPSVENYHNLRKRVKYLMYHMQILQPIWPEYFKLTSKMLDNTSDQLGLDHDYAELIRFIGEIETVKLSEERKRNFVDWLQGVRSELQSPAMATLEKMYVEKPTSFIDRVEKYFSISSMRN